MPQVVAIPRASVRRSWRMSRPSPALTTDPDIGALPPPPGASSPTGHPESTSVDPGTGTSTPMGLSYRDGETRSCDLLLSSWSKRDHVVGKIAAAQRRLDLAHEVAILSANLLARQAQALDGSHRNPQLASNLALGQPGLA